MTRFLSTVFVLFFLVGVATKGHTMETLSVLVDQQKTAVGAAEVGGEIYVALDDFCATVATQAKYSEEGGPLTVCREDLCIPLSVGGTEDTLTVAGVLFARLAAFGEPLGLSWTQNNGSVLVTFAPAIPGLGIGNTPPFFALPDLYSGASVSPSDYRGKKTVFYMWASW